MAPIFCSKFLKLLNQTKFQEKCRNHENCNFFSKENLSFRGVVVITLVSLSKGPQFKPGWGLNPFDTLPQHSVLGFQKYFAPYASASTVRVDFSSSSDKRQIKAEIS